MPSSTNRDVVQELQEILRQWEEDLAVPSRDPTPHLTKLCHLFERETVNFLKKDPDPFDDRHPMTLEPECALGMILRALFRKDNFVTKLVNHYLRENYFTSQGLTQDSNDLNVATCRLLLDILYGLDVPQVRVCVYSSSCIHLVVFI
ncbi:Protein mahjong [Chionoecetes opilio]|uniref:Protein mahjong n=1 Tax=Chionoecetes opilio TaxID=41210 RepID=A0A8J5CPL4_CHIOP|nr:Protein mahjong [Chionoecetes opilio]